MQTVILRRLSGIPVAVLVGVAICTAGLAIAADDVSSLPPAVGDEAPDFSLTRLDGEMFKLSELTKKSPVVLLVLRGYPEYQCPVCSKQVGRFLAAASKFKEADAQIVMVYPGAAEELQKRAEEFITGQTLPEHFHLVIDPDYAFTNAWNLRWDAPMETAYPSTFVIGTDGNVRLAKVSKSHGGRSSVDEVLKALEN